MNTNLNNLLKNLNNPKPESQIMWFVINPDGERYEVPFKSRAAALRSTIDNTDVFALYQKLNPRESNLEPINDDQLIDDLDECADILGYKIEKR